MWTIQQLAIMERQLPDFDPLPADDHPTQDPSPDWLVWAGAMFFVLFCVL